MNSSQVWLNPQYGHIVDKAWTLQKARLAPADNNPAVTLEWRLQSDAGMHLGGWNIDDVEVYTFKQIPPPEVQLTMTPAQVAPGGKTRVEIKGTAKAAAFLLLSDGAGPINIPGLPTLKVGPVLLPLLVVLDGKGEAGFDLNIPGDSFLTGAMVHSQVVEVSGTTTPVVKVSNPMLTLIGK